MVEITFRAILTGLVIVFFAQFLIAMVDKQVELASKRDALNTFRNGQLSLLTTRFSASYLALDCTRSARTVLTDECRSDVANFLTNLDAVYLELKVHYPNCEFPKLIQLREQAENFYANAPQTDQDSIKDFAVTFGAALNEMSQNFK